MKSKIYFLSFADSRMQTAAERIAEQAKQMGVFEDVFVLNETLLGDDFKRKWQQVLQPGVRGFGYWCWKPYIILKTLEKLSDNDILLYCDAGCHLNPKGLTRLLCYFEQLRNDALGIKAFTAHYSLIDVKERRWTKGSIFDFFDCRNKTSVTDSAQIAATQVMIRKCYRSMDFVNEWYDAICKDFALIDDTPSKSKNLSGFIEGRHDQSIFSVLFKLRGGIAFPSKETELGLGGNKDELPIWNIRDRGYKDTRFIARLKRWLKSRKILFKIRFIRLKEKVASFLYNQ